MTALTPSKIRTLIKYNKYRDCTITPECIDEILPIMDDILDTCIRSQYGTHAWLKGRHTLSGAGARSYEESLKLFGPTGLY